MKVPVTLPLFGGPRRLPTIGPYALRETQIIRFGAILTAIMNA